MQKRGERTIWVTVRSRRSCNIYCHMVHGSLSLFNSPLFPRHSWGKGIFLTRLTGFQFSHWVLIQEVSSLGSGYSSISSAGKQQGGVLLPSGWWSSLSHAFSLSASPFSLFLSLSSVLSQPTQPHRLTKCPEEYSALSSACFWPKYFVYILKYQPFTYSTKLSKFPWGLRLFHDKCQKDKQAISEFSPFPDSPGAIKYWLNDRGAAGGRGETLVGEKKQIDSLKYYSTSPG